MKPPWVPHPRESPVLPAAEQGWGEPTAQIPAVAALLGLDPASPPRPLPLCHHGDGVTPPGNPAAGAEGAHRVHRAGGRRGSGAGPRGMPGRSSA